MNKSTRTRYGRFTVVASFASHSAACAFVGQNKGLAVLLAEANEWLVVRP